MKFSLITFVLSVLLSTAVASEDVELELVPRYEWDEALIQKRQDPASEPDVALEDQAQLLWTTPNKTEKHTTVSLIVWSRADSLIIDMAKFAFALKSAECKPNMTLQFYHKKAFERARKEWEWVNFNGIRSFVMIGDHFKCGKDWSLYPWLVSNARYNETSFTIYLDARQSTWKQVTHRYNIDFGEVSRQKGLHDKRQFGWTDFDLSKAFTIPLAMKFPSSIIKKKWPNADFAVNCADCGTTGGLVFAGHIEGSFFPPSVDQFTLSVTPSAIQANLGLEVSFGGSYNFTGQDFARQEFELIDIPLPSSWSIPQILHFGPKAKVIAGYELEAISGRATVSTGISASISDDSLAKVEIFGKRNLDIHGWVPTFAVQPLTVEAEVTASGSLYAGIAVAIALEILEDTSINLDLNLKFPEVHITATAGYNAAGFCPNNNNPFGVSLEATLGAELELIAWNELDSKRNNLFEVDLYEKDDIYKFEPLCFAFGEGTPGSCSALPDVETEDDMVDWVKRSGYIGGATSLARRQEEDQPMGVLATPRRYYLKCDTNKKYKPVTTEDYHSGPEIIAMNPAVAAMPSGVPALFPLITCDDIDDDDCLPNKWKVKELIKVSNIADHDDDVKANEEGNLREFGNRLNVGNWAAEHVYEGNWIRNFFDYLYDTHFKNKADGNAPGERCDHVANTIAKTGDPAGLAQTMMKTIGNKNTFLRTMVLLPQKENTLKFGMFAEKIKNGVVDPDKPAIDRKLRMDSSMNDTPYKEVEEAACALGHVINVCKYMEHATVRRVMNNTLQDLDDVLANFDAKRDRNDGGPDSYQDAHRKFINIQIANGIVKGRKAIKLYASNIKNKMSDYDDMDKTLTGAIDDIVQNGADTVCPNSFRYP